MKTLLISFCFCWSFHILMGQNADTQKPIKIGDEYLGGIVFKVDASGEHGLISAPYDQKTSKVRWGNTGNTDALSLSDGQGNTNKIIKFFENSQRLEKPAAYICDTLTMNGYTDWYLPAIEELEQMYNERFTIGNFLYGDYCSSTEMRRADAYAVHFRPHRRVVFYYNKYAKDYYIRCVRKF